MRMRTLLTSVAAASIIAATSVSFIPDAQAQKSATLSPKTSWAVTNIADSGTGTGAYCAIARRFADNLILTVAKNQQNETSFALDFPKGSFDPQQSFAVVLDPGAGQQRNYDVRPASKSAFVVRLGHDKPFFTALQKTGYLRAEVNGQTYSFNLADIDKGQSKLDSCLVSAAGLIDPIVAPPLTPQLASPKVAQAVPDKAVPGKINPFPSRAADGSSAAGLVKKVNALESQNKNLRNQITAKQAPAALGGGSPTDIGHLRHEVDTLRKENLALSAQMESLKAGGPENSPLKQKIEALQQENIKLSAIVSAGAATDGGSTGILQSLAAENQRLQAALNENGSTLGEGVSVDAQSIQGLTERLQTLEKENLGLSESLEIAKAGTDQSSEARIKELQTENQQLQAQISAESVQSKGISKEEVARLEQSAQDLKTKNDMLSQQIETLQVAVESGSTDGTQMNNLKKKISDLETENFQLQESLASAQPSAGEEAPNVAELLAEELLAENESLQANLSIETTLGSTQKTIIGNLEAELGTLKEQNKKLQADISIARTEADGLSQSLDEAKGESEELLKKASEAVSNQEEMAELRGRLKQATEENATLVGELAQISTSAGEKSMSLENEVKGLRRGNALLQEELEGMRRGYVDSEAAKTLAESLKAQNTQLKRELYKMTEAAKQGQGQAAQIKTLISENERLSKDVAAKDAELAKELASLNESVQKLQEENKQLNETALKTAESNKAELEKKTAALQKLTEENQKLQESLESKSSIDVAAKEAADKVVKENVAALQAKLDELQKSNDTLTVSLESLGGEADSYQALIQKQQEEITGLKKENETLRQEIEAAQAGASVADVASVDHAKVIEENAQLKNKIEGLTEKTGTEESAAMQKLVQENSRLKQQLQKVAVNTAAPKAITASYQPPVTLKRPPVPSVKPYIRAKVEHQVAQNDTPEHNAVQNASSQTTVSGNGDLPRSENLLQSITEAPAAQEALRPSANEAQREEANMVRGLASRKAISMEPIMENKAEQAVKKAVSEDGTASKASFDIHDILRSAAINLTRQVEVVEAASKDGITAYQWRSDNLYGSAEQRKLEKASDFDTFVQQYLARTKARCPGDFAALSDGPTRQGGMRMDSYEVACIGGDVSSSATVLFFEADGKFNVVAHEADASNMDVAMEVRDRLVKAIAGTPI
ncbi:MAG: hypothetical protein DHS20C02_11490 [Micavibrio sp.]|nr:MAG: hypothetical protein DHS20C02_11490 [Micavibrio sp.]